MLLRFRLLGLVLLTQFHQPAILADDGRSGITNVEGALRYFEEISLDGGTTAEINGTTWRYQDPYWEGVSVDFDAHLHHSDILLGDSDKSDLKAWLLERSQKWILIAPGKNTPLESLLFVIESCNNEKISYSLLPLSDLPELRLSAFEKTRLKK